MYLQLIILFDGPAGGGFVMLMEPKSPLIYKIFPVYIFYHPNIFFLNLFFENHTYGIVAKSESTNKCTQKSSIISSDPTTKAPESFFRPTHMFHLGSVDLYK